MNKKTALTALTLISAITTVSLIAYFNIDDKKEETIKILEAEKKEILSDEKPKLENEKKAEDVQADPAKITGETGETSVSIIIEDTDVQNIQREIYKKESKKISGYGVDLSENSTTERKSIISTNEIYPFWNREYIIDSMQFTLTNPGKWFEIKNQKDATNFLKAIIESNQKIDSKFVLITEAKAKKNKNNTEYCSEQYVSQNEDIKLYNHYICVETYNSNNNVSEVRGVLLTQNKIKQPSKEYNNFDSLMNAKKIEKHLTNFNLSDYVGKFYYRALNDEYLLSHIFKNTKNEVLIISSEDGLPL
jgi:hypothetical protein